MSRRSQVRGVDRERFVEMRSRIGGKRAPVRHRSVPRLALRCKLRPMSQLVVSSGATIAARRAPLLCSCSSQRPSMLSPRHELPPRTHQVSASAVRSNLPDYSQRQSLRSLYLPAIAPHFDLHWSSAALRQTLRSEHMFHLGRPDVQTPESRKLPCVLVWLSPHTMVMPRLRQPQFGAMTCTIPWSGESNVEQRMPKSLQFLCSAWIWLRRDRIGDRCSRGSVGMFMVHRRDRAQGFAVWACLRRVVIEGLRGVTSCTK